MYSLVERMRARRCYVQDGLTYEELSVETGVSIAQLKKWGKIEGWKTARKKLLASALAGDTDQLDRQKADEENVLKLVGSLSRRPKKVANPV